MMQRVHSRRWQPPSRVPTRDTGVYILHGTGEHCGRYEHLAGRLADLGFRVGSHDHIGHGQSAGKRGVIDPPGALVTQAAIECQKFAFETGSLPVLFGHSLGGVAAVELVVEHGLPVAGLILSAPAFVPYTRWRDRVQVSILAHLAPTFTVERPYDASRLTHDEQIQRKAEADPLNHGFKSASLIDWLLTSGQRQLINAHTLDTDTLMLLAGGDIVVDSSRSEQFVQTALAEKMTVHRYAGYHHEILNETADRAEVVFSDIERWMLARF